jgi:photosystem II stability/assembly factor-like uncharacterized protein
MRGGILTWLCLLPTVTHAAEVDDWVNRHIEARGGKAALQAVHMLRRTGEVRFGEDGSVQAAWAQVVQRATGSRTEVTMQGLTSVEAWTGKTGWEFDPFGGRREARTSSADEVRALLQDADFDGPLVDWQAKGHGIEDLGMTTVDGADARQLRVRLADGDELTLYLDAGTGLLVRQVKARRIRGVEHVTETDFSDYGKVAGLWLPFRIEAGRKGGAKTTRLLIARAEVNATVDAALFRQPSPGQAVTRAVLADAKAPAPDFTAPATAATDSALDARLVAGLGIRNLGSASMSGRISALTAHHDGGKTTVWVGAASGGVWKSTDGGTTFKPVFDDQPVQSIGAIAVDPSNPQTVWVGTGESWTRNSVSVGDGIYRTTDGGTTWRHMGLPESERIARILVHPKRSDSVWVCVPGKLWSDSTERGVYRTQDGGKTWQLVLRGGNGSTGCSGLSLNPQNPDELFAGLWDFRRKGWTFRSGGDGPEASSGSGLYRSADGGSTWQEVTGQGLPGKPWGRVEVAVAPSNPKIVYAFVESRDSGLFRSDDGGATWQARDKSQAMVWRPFYFARLVVDPTNPDRLFKPNGALIVSEDGGKSFAGTGGGAHGDWHDLWIDPANPKHVLGGDDGGFWLSRDGGNRWWKGANLPISQFYHVAVDQRDPYRVYGGLQDNSSWVAPSQHPGGITNAQWQNLFDGDGFWTVPDPSDPDGVYAEWQGGHIGRVDMRHHTIRDIQPTAGYKEKLRYNWNAPIATSPHDPKVLYLGAQFLFRSRDRGDSWQRISPDLTTNDPAKQRQELSGGITVDNSSAEMHTTIYAIAESPLDPKLIWVGTDDGNLQLTRDGGKTWSNVAPKVAGLPPNSWVTWIEPSRSKPGTAYATFDRHTFGDLTPWLYRTDDFGQSWQRLATPEQGVRGYAHVVREDPVQPRVLYLGTEFGLWLSVDGGARWLAYTAQHFPHVAVRDLQIHPREHDLIVGTHGRGVWIIDDLTPLRGLTPEVLKLTASFLPGRATQQRMPGHSGWAEGDAQFIGENPPAGAVVSYWLGRRHLFGPLKLEVLDAQGQLVETLPAGKSRGLNRVVWSMQVKPPPVPRAATLAWAGTAGPRVLPGTYTVRLTAAGQVVESKLEVKLDARAPYTLAERKQQFDAAMAVHGLFGDMTRLAARIEAARGLALEKAKAQELAFKLRQQVSGGTAKPPAGERDWLGLADKLESCRKRIVATKEGGAITGEERLREHADALYGALLGWEGKPAKTLLERTGVLKRELADVQAEVEALLQEAQLEVPVALEWPLGPNGAGAGCWRVGEMGCATATARRR